MVIDGDIIGFGDRDNNTFELLVTHIPQQV